MINDIVQIVDAQMFIRHVDPECKTEVGRVEAITLDRVPNMKIDPFFRRNG